MPQLNDMSRLTVLSSIGNDHHSVKSLAPTRRRTSLRLWSVPMISKSRFITKGGLLQIRYHWIPGRLRLFRRWTIGPASTSAQKREKRKDDGSLKAFCNETGSGSFRSKWTETPRMDILEWGSWNGIARGIHSYVVGVRWEV